MLKEIFFSRLKKGPPEYVPPKVKHVAIIMWEPRGKEGKEDENAK